MNKIDVVSITFAELALAMLFCVTAVLLPSYQRLKAENKQLTKSSRSQVDVASLRKQIENLQNENLQLKSRFLADRKNLRSAAIPSCFEKLKRDSWLGSVVIIGRNEFQVGGQSLTFTQLLLRYDPELRNADASGCRERVKVFYAPSLPVDDYDYALRTLEQYVYTKRMGPA